MSILRRYKIQLETDEDSNPSIRSKGLMNPADMKEHNLETGEMIFLSLDAQNSPFAIAAAWPSSEVGRNVLCIGASTALTCAAFAGNELSILPLNRLPLSLAIDPDIRDATTLSFTELLDSDHESRLESQSLEENAGPSPKKWARLLLREILVSIHYISQHQIVQASFRGRTRKYKLISAQGQSSLEGSLGRLNISGEVPHPSFWKASWETVISILPPELPQQVARVELDSTALRANVGGLNKQIEELSELLELPLSRPELFSQFGLKPPRGVLLFGPPGTGKTHLARSLAEASGATLITISGPELSSAYHGETESALRRVFDEAVQKAPCVLVFDEIDALAPKREDLGGLVEARVVTTLLTLMDGIDLPSSNSKNLHRVVIIATTNRPNAIDPALRRPGRFDREIEIGVPDASGRLAILRVLLSKIPHNLTPYELEQVSSQTHGFVGADLSAAVRDAGTKALRRLASVSKEGGAAVPLFLTMDDLQTSLRGVRPSALREHIIEAPQVRWSDIGGQQDVKQKLKECVEWPVLHPSAFARLGISPPRGVLLYGPPGCSKTLTAKALATESGINFISIKGPELINKYVGESERAVRDIFRKARSAAPSIIFFDEIDALATARSELEGQGAQQGVLTSLLTEMDGVQDLMGVIVVGATNRPDVLDSALMRPGRLDRILYVGPPDHGGRLEIFRIQLRKMAVEPGLDLEKLAQMTKGCSGAEIVAMCQDAALKALQKDINVDMVGIEDFMSAAENVRHQITPLVVAKYTQWRDASGLSQA